MFDLFCGCCWLVVVLFVICLVVKVLFVSVGFGFVVVVFGELWVFGLVVGGDVLVWFGFMLGDMGFLGLFLVYNLEKNKYKLIDKLYCKVWDCVFFLDVLVIWYFRLGLVGFCLSLWISIFYYCFDVIFVCGGLIEK